jgi:ABC-type multidrug transport system ATPase subunit
VKRRPSSGKIKKKCRGPNMIIFEAHHACKKIEGTKILDDVSFRIKQGERIAITGSNGSGKSSLLKLIGGIYENTSGQVKRYLNIIGYAPEHFPENIRFKLNDFLLLTGEINGIPTYDVQKKVKYYADFFAITEFLDTPLRSCSKGTKQKAGIIQSILKEPSVLLLDEPLTGLDKNSKEKLMHHLHTLEGVTIIFTAHDSLLIEKLADRVIKMKDGRIISDSVSGLNEELRIIKCKINGKESIANIPFMTCDFLSEDEAEIVISANLSDTALQILLERGCSIIEVREKR